MLLTRESVWMCHHCVYAPIYVTCYCPIVGKHDVVHKTEKKTNSSASKRTAKPQPNNIHRKFGEVCGMLACSHFHRHTDVLITILCSHTSKKMIEFIMPTCVAATLLQGQCLNLVLSSARPGTRCLVWWWAPCRCLSASVLHLIFHG